LGGNFCPKELMNALLKRIAQNQPTLQEVRSAAWPLKQPDYAKMARMSLNVCDNCKSEVPNGINCYIGFNPHMLYCPTCAVKLGKWPAPPDNWSI